MKKKNLLLAFSGGKTSAYMTKWVLENMQKDFCEIKVVFANTGQEHEETLNFVNSCDKEFGFNLTWVEAKVHHQSRVGTTHQIVNFETASREGEPFEDVIKKYGIPNHTHPICTRELKLRPIQSYLKSIGWKKKSYYTALGIRMDEVHRISSRCGQDKIIYPLIENHPMDKIQINIWWAQQEFNLYLKEHQGNCKWCWKKSKRKLLTLAKESPEIFNFPHTMETIYGRIGAEFSKDNHAEYANRVFFRGNMSTKSLLVESTTFTDTFTDKNYIFDSVLDAPNGCSESCEIFPTK